MTESNFIALHFPNGPENLPGALHLNVNQVGNTPQGLISSMIITYNAYSINGNTIDTYIESVLEQIESVKFNFLDTPYELVINSRTQYIASNPFFYYTVEPAYVPNYFDGELLIRSIKDITFTPYLQNIQFNSSEFNPLISNASNSRKSDRIMVSDRLETTINPSNITVLLSETAAKAQIQDSLYSDTGWTNARYKGSSTSGDESGGISPTISGLSFIGEVFPSDSDTDYICALDNRINQELFHTADSTLPTFSIGDLKITLADDFGPQQTRFNYSSIVTGSVELGDVLKTPGLVGGPPEYLKIVGINSDDKEITTIRDIYNNYLIIPSSYSTGTVFNKVDRFDIFRFGTSQNRIQLVNNSRIYVNGNNTIIDTDDFGQILSSSQCPYIGYIVQD